MESYSIIQSLPQASFTFYCFLFVFIAGQYPTTGIYHNFFIHSQVDGHVGCFRVLAIMTKATIGIRVQLFV